MGFKSDIEIAQETQMTVINEIADKLDIHDEYVENYGKYKAKIDYRMLKQYQDKTNGKLILVTAINPTPAGEGKTTTTVGLGDALSAMGKKTVIALREPSLGPVFGVKGGAAGGGYCAGQCGPAGGFGSINLFSCVAATPAGLDGVYCGRALFWHLPGVTAL